ncbi:MAG TPA: helix-turn-helix transcriptional regulator [Chloroflexia bacterium]|nr:helix-turn-helix transcriptional regulator [Chloroflexia bacterium]
MTSISARVLGQRVRQLRTRRGLTQQDLAGNDYSKSYISAIEQGKTRPSLEALQRIASRLEVPAGTLLDPEAQGFMPFDPEALPRRVRRRRSNKAGTMGAGPADPARIEYQVAQSQLLIESGRAAEALAALRLLIPGESSTNQQRIDDVPLQKIYLLAARAAISSGDAEQGLDYAQKGMQVSTRLGDRDSLERLRNVLGRAFYEAEQPLSALEHHRDCLQAIEAGVVSDLNFQIEVSANMALDYGALHDPSRALEVYRSALERLPDENGLDDQVEIFQRVAAAYAEHDDYAAARLYTEKAAHIHEARNNIQAAARIESRYGDMLVERGELTDAEQHLEHSIKVANAQNSEVDQATALTSLARLYMKRDDFGRAGETVGRAIDVSRGIIYSAGYGEHGRLAEDVSAYMQPQAGTEAHRTLAQALALGGEVASRLGDDQKSDLMFDEAIQMIESNHAADISSDIYQRYAQVLAARGRHEQATRYFERAYRTITKKN